MPLFEKIAIIGLGLIGGSIAKAAKKNLVVSKISASNHSYKSIKYAIEHNIIDEGFIDPESAVIDADMVILCTPIGSYAEIIDKISPKLKKGAIITDVGSVKSYVIESVLPLLDGEQKKHFIPGHPIAGSEKSGVEASSGDLYVGKQQLLTPLEFLDKASVEKVKQFWEKIGAVVSLIDANEHDRIYAASSHVPHLISFCYANLLYKLPKDVFESILKENNREFKKFLRLTGSNAKMWSDIFIYNKEAILEIVSENFSFSDINDFNYIEKLDKSRSRRGSLGGFSDCKNYSKDVLPYMDFLPHIIACKIIESVDDFSHVGAGFLGVTEIIFSDISTHYEEELIQKIKGEIKLITDYITRSDSVEIIKYIGNSTEVYDKFCK